MPFRQRLFEQNRRWAAQMTREDPNFFQELACLQTPDYLWIGCSDARVPANEIVGLKPGELFVHRNIANLVHEIDINCLSVLVYAVDVLKVRHIIVTGHYGCGGVRAAMERTEVGLVDNWLKPVRSLYQFHLAELEAIADHDARLARLCELNVRQQVMNVCRTPTVQHAWARGQKLSVHGFIYDLHDGILKDLGYDIGGLDGIEPIHRVVD